uniref:C-type lectin domain-containing protein n=1 Tax=Sinocyclocheilus grahami TaxID=75366 RepID=A0A672L9N4_SINGR
MDIFLTKTHRFHFLPLSALMSVTFSQRREFVFVPTLMNWMNAQKYCRQHYSDLATVHDQTNLNELLKTTGLGKFWFGLYRTTGNGVFVWSEQSRSSFTRWKLGQPDIKLCVIVQNGYWVDSNCEDYFPFACYFAKNIGPHS